MFNTRKLVLGATLVGALALAGCGGSAATSAAPADGGATESANSGNGGGGGGESFARVTIDGETWEYSSFLCVRGYENTESDVYSFSSTSFTTSDGEKVQFLVDARDDSGQDRIEGDGVTYEVTLYDYSGEQPPSVDISADSATGVTITDTSVTVSGEFVDVEGVSFQIEAEAVCN